MKTRIWHLELMRVACIQESWCIVSDQIRKSPEDLPTLIYSPAPLSPPLECCRQECSNLLRNPKELQEHLDKALDRDDPDECRWIVRDSKKDRTDQYFNARHDWKAGEGPHPR